TFVVSRIAQSATRPEVHGPVAAGFFLVAGDLFDFVLETFFGFTLLATALGLAAARSLNEGERGIVVQPAFAMTGSVTFSLLLGATTPSVWEHNQRTLDEAIVVTSGAQREAVVGRAFALHPADGQYAYALALERRRRRDPQGALGWANRALLLAPSHPGAHLEAARALYALGYEQQALLEYRLAWQARGGDEHRLVNEVAQRTKDPHLRRLAVPHDDARALGAMCEVLVSEARLEEAQACFDDASSLPEATTALLRRGVELALRRLDSEGAAVRLARLLGEKTPDGLDAPLAASTKKLAQGIDVALTESDAWLERGKDLAPLLWWRLAEFKALQREGEVDETLLQLERRAKNRSDVDRVERTKLVVLRHRGELADALRLARRIAARTPKDVGLWIELAELELTLGLLDAAEVSHRQAQAVAPTHPRVTSLGERLSVLRQQKDEAQLQRLIAPDR
ncbi:MAG: hypothetical protein ACO3JL_20620, partial [Myxococcota bacterium]